MNIFLTNFNKMAEEFLERLVEYFPQEDKIRTYRVKFLLLKKLNNKKPVEMFMENLEPFGLQIINRDEDFFKKPSHVNHVENISGKIGLVDYWESTDSETQNSIWEFIKSLYLLGMNAIGKHDELIQIIKNNKNI